MSRFITGHSYSTVKEEIESMEVCRWRINEICCNDKSEYLGDYPYPNCKCENKKQCIYYKKEDGVIGR